MTLYNTSSHEFTSELNDELSKLDQQRHGYCKGSTGNICGGPRIAQVRILLTGKAYNAANAHQGLICTLVVKI